MQFVKVGVSHEIVQTFMHVNVCHNLTFGRVGG